jgi:hypothetical protein
MWRTRSRIRNYVIKLEYFEEKISASKKEKLKEEAEDLTRTLERSQEGQE